MARNAAMTDRYEFIAIGSGPARGFWCKQATIRDDGRMQPFVPVEALFKGRQFSGKIIMLCVSWYASFKLSLRDLLITMADRGIRLTHTTILRWVQRGIREALEPIRSSSRRILEDGRDLYKGWGTLGLPVSCCGQGRPHRTRPPNKITRWMPMRHRIARCGK